MAANWMGSYYVWLLWFQTVYSVWQFVRVAKFFRLPYCTLNNVVNASLGYAQAPFQVCQFCVVKAITPADIYSEMGGVPSFLMKPPSGVSPTSRRDEYSLDHPLLGKRRFISHNLYSKYNSIRSYISFKPSYVCTNADLIVPGFYILDSLRHSKAIGVVMSGEFKLEHFTARCIVTFDRDLELNQNFMRLLSIFPLALQAKNFQKASLFISLAIIVLDQCSIIANLAWKHALRTMYWYYRFNILNKVPRPQWRYYLSVWLGSVSSNFLCCNESSYSFKFIKPGDIYPTMLDHEVNADVSVYGEQVMYNYHVDDTTQYKIGDAKEVHYKGEIHDGEFEIYKAICRGNEIKLYINDRGTFYCKNNFKDYCCGTIGYSKDVLLDKLRLIEDSDMLPVCFIRDNVAQVISIEQFLTTKLSFIHFYKASILLYVGMPTLMYY